MLYRQISLDLLLLCLPFPGGALSAAEPAPLQIGDGSQWAFVNSQWKDTEAGGIVGERTGDGDGLQGYCLAFLKDRDYTDLEATFTVQMNTNHADEGLIVRAQDPTRLALIHFPQTGQQLRDGTLLRFCTDSIRHQRNRSVSRRKTAGSCA